jgi:hypothetical protein
MNWTQFRHIIISNLTDELLTPKYRQLKKTYCLPATTGHCYIVSEVAYYLLDGKEEGWTPQYIKHEGNSHWFLKHTSGFILDLTADQFTTLIDYSKAKGKGFLTRIPSKRSKTLIRRIDESGKLWLPI